MAGTFEYLDAAAALQELLAKETLGKGHMGTDENLLSIILARFPELVRACALVCVCPCALVSTVQCCVVQAAVVCCPA